MWVTSGIFLLLSDIFASSFSSHGAYSNGVWRDFKSRCCTKAAKYNREKAQTGNRGVNIPPLSELEKRVISLVGAEYTIGTNCPDSMPEEDAVQRDLEVGVVVDPFIDLSHSNPQVASNTEEIQDTYIIADPIMMNYATSTGTEGLVYHQPVQASPNISSEPSTSQQALQITTSDINPRDNPRDSRQQAPPRRNRGFNPRRSIAEQHNSARSDFLAVAESNADAMKSQSPLQYPSRKSMVRRQTPVPLSTPFPCAEAIPRGRSKYRPTSVHRLRPGDIDVVAAIGDSLIAGNGALEEYALGTIIEYRGISWCAGGEATWREYLTLPNILKEFNPELRGYSTGTGEWLTKNSRLNVAFPVASDQDALKQAKILVERMRVSPDVDIARDWKMVTIFMGANDLCSASCLSPVAWSPTAHARKLARAIDYLQAHLPRTVVNLVPVLDVSVSVRVLRPLTCRLLHSLFCTCFHQGGGELEDLVRMARLYQKAENLLVESGRYDGRDDFTVLIQPFMRLFNAPLPLPHPLPLVIHQSYITHDCFHFSQKGHALAANLLWNNLLEPVGNKTDNDPPILWRSFRCPSREAPFIFTAENSKSYLSTGVQDGAFDDDR